MELLKNKILSHGIILSDNIIKVDSFLNHQLDSNLMFEMGKEFFSRFKNENITKIVTIESSGIAVAIMAGYHFNLPVVFARKHKPSNLPESVYKSSAVSFTKKINYDIIISTEYLNENDRVLLIDDFLATGNAMIALTDLVSQSKASLAGVGIVIEKSFQDGGKILRDKGIRVDSLAIVKKISKDSIIFEN